MTHNIYIGYSKNGIFKLFLAHTSSWSIVNRIYFGAVLPIVLLVEIGNKS